MISSHPEACRCLITVGSHRCSLTKPDKKWRQRTLRDCSSQNEKCILLINTLQCWPSQKQEGLINPQASVQHLHCFVSTCVFACQKWGIALWGSPDWFSLIYNAMFLSTVWCIIFIWTLEGATGLTLVFSLCSKNPGVVESHRSKSFVYKKMVHKNQVHSFPELSGRYICPWEILNESAHWGGTGSYELISLWAGMLWLLLPSSRWIWLINPTWQRKLTRLFHINPEIWTVLDIIFIRLELWWY